jgi:hypothetical protein
MEGSKRAAELPARACWRRSSVARRIATPCVEIPASDAPDVVPGPCRTAAQDGSGRQRTHAGAKVGGEATRAEGVLHRGALHRQARVDGRCHKQLVADASRRSRWTRAERYLPDESAETQSCPEDPSLPAGAGSPTLVCYTSRVACPHFESIVYQSTNANASVRACFARISHEIS